MATATFYLENESTLNTHEYTLNKVCQLSYFFIQKGLRVYIATQEQTQAQAIDEILWKASPRFFVPHNLVGEGPPGGAQVEIGWSNIRRFGQRHVLINLTESTSVFAPTFAQVVDFVPCEETCKKGARERYKIYRMAGYTMHTLPLDAISPLSIN